MTEFSLALVGAPNCGKSTLFNGLTGGRAKVANYAGVTVERRSGRFETPAGREVELVDLPGIYGLTTRSPDERIAVDAITGKLSGRAPDALMVLIDATDLRTSLPLVLQLKALGRPMLLALNMIDLAERDGVKIDVAALEAQLGIPVAATRATRTSGRVQLLERLDQLLATPVPPSGLAQAPEADLRAIQKQARAIAKAVLIAEPAMNRVTRAVDKVVLNKIAGPLILATILFLTFQAVFTWAQAPMDAIDAGVGALTDWIRATAPDAWWRGLITDGVIAGVGSVIKFLPQIVILFALILVLEASGYMARAAFLMDELMLRVGLNGRAFIPLLSSFACAIPGMMAARVIENDRDRLTTILVAPLMTCSARLPVYTLIIGAFIPNTRVLGVFGLQGVVLFGLYLMGIVSAVIVAFVMKRTVTKGQTAALLMVLPTYKLPDAKDFFLNLWGRAWAFLKRAGTIIFSTSVVLWFLASFPFGSTDIHQTVAGRIGSVLELIFRPIGFNLEIAIALVPGLAAREVVVGALGTVYAVQSGTNGHDLGAVMHHAWSLPTALAFLAWYVYAPQCIATMAVARRETNSWRWTALMIGYLFALAYVVAGLVYWGARAAGL